jgi:hypothetical protein
MGATLLRLMQRNFEPGPHWSCERDNHGLEGATPRALKKERPAAIVDDQAAQASASHGRSRSGLRDQPVAGH